MLPDVGEAGADSPADDGDAAERIDRFVAGRLAALSHRLSTSDEPIDDQLAEEVRTLARLSALRQHLRQPRPKRPVLLVSLLSVTAAIVTSFVFVRLQSVPMELDIDCSAVSFRMRRAAQLTRVSQLTLMQAGSFAPLRWELTNAARVLSMEPPMELRPGPEGALTLSSVTIPMGAVVTIQRTADEGTWRLGLDHRDSSAAVTVAGPVSVIAAMLPLTIFDFGAGVPLVVHAEPPPSARLEFDVTPLDVMSFLSDGLLEIDQLSFEEKIEEPSDGAVGTERVRASSVIGGAVFNQSLGGRETRLRRRASVEVDLVSGLIRELRLEPAVLHVVAAGLARELKVGVPRALTTLRPSWLEWLTHHHGLQLAWGAGAWLLALFIGGIRWWRTLDVD
jgi:hypothetical protein